MGMKKQLLIIGTILILLVLNLSGCINEGVKANPSINVKKLISIDGGITYLDANEEGLEVQEGNNVYFKLVVTNDGSVPLQNIDLNDTYYDASMCPVPNTLNAGESFECIMGPISAIFGQHITRATVTVIYNGETVEDTDSVIYTCKNASQEVFYSDLPVSKPTKVVLVIDRTTYDTLKTEIDRFAADISLDLNVSIAKLVDNFNSPSEVKDSLKNEKNTNGDFQGVILIGDIPFQYTFQLEFVSMTGSLNASEMNALADDNYYLDLEEKNIYVEKTRTTFNCNDAQRVFNPCPDIILGVGTITDTNRWISRILPPLSKSNRMELLKNYFDRDHAYRQGNLHYDGALVYGPNVLGCCPWYDQQFTTCKDFNDCFSEAKKTFVDTGITTEDKLKIIIGSDNDSTKDAYLLEQQKPYKIQYISTHGSPTSLWLDNNEYLFYSDLVNNPTGVLFTCTDACMQCLFDYKDNLATAYLFEGNGLAVLSGGWNPFASMANDGLDLVIGAGGRTYETTKYNVVFGGDPTLKINDAPLNKSKCKLVINQTRIDFGNITVSKDGNIISEGKQKWIKIKNDGSDPCILDQPYITPSFVFGSYPDVHNLQFANYTLEPGETLDVGIGLVSGDYLMNYFNFSGTNSLEITGTMKFISNDPQYIKSIPVTATLIKET